MFSDLRFRLRALFRRGTMERELDEELRFHIEQAIGKYVAGGMAPSEAARQARLAFGGVERIKDESRDQRGISWFERRGADLRLATRGMRRQPAFTAVVVATLGLGLGANVAVFRIVDRLLLQPPAYLHDPARVHRVYLQGLPGRIFVFGRGGDAGIPSIGTMAYPRFRDLQRWTTSCDRVAAFADVSLAIGTGQNTQERWVSAVSGDYFDLFDARPAAGRFLAPPDDRAPAGSPVAVLSHAFWRSQYGGRPDIVGTALQIGPLIYTIVGVAPEGFVGVETTNPPIAFIPLTSYAYTRGVLEHPDAYVTSYNAWIVTVLARRRPGVGTTAAAADLTNAFRRSLLAERASSARRTDSLDLHRARALVTPVIENRGPDRNSPARLATWTGGLAMIVLLIACANVANLLLARTLQRRREFAMRLALGVTRGRLLAQVLTETLVLAALGVVAAIAIAEAGGAVLRPLFVPDAPSSAVIADGRALVFAGLAALVAGVFTGLVPVFAIDRSDCADAFKAGLRDTTYRGSRARVVLLVFQAALSVVLVVGAGLFVRSLQAARAVRLGLDVEHLIAVQANLRGLALPVGQQYALAHRLVDGARVIPGVTGVARAESVPFWSIMSEDFTVPGVDSVDRLGFFTLQAVSPQYFTTVGTRILRGRGILETDRARGPRVVVVSAAMARTLWPGRDALGQCMKFGADTNPCTTVVGIAEDARQVSIADDIGLRYYLSVEQYDSTAGLLFVRVRDQADGSIQTVRRELQRLMPGATYVTATPLRAIVDTQVKSWELGATMFLVFGALALALAAVGLYSVIAYAVAQRTHELGVRAALGARLGDVLRLIIADGLRFAVAGIVIGSGIALVAGQWVRPLLFGEQPADPLVFGIAIGVLLMTAAASSVIPAWRAARVDPMEALRAD